MLQSRVCGLLDMKLSLIFYLAARGALAPLAEHDSQYNKLITLHFNGQAATGGLAVFSIHVFAGFEHGFDNFIE